MLWELRCRSWGFQGFHAGGRAYFVRCEKEADTGSIEPELEDQILEILFPSVEMERLFPAT